MKILFLHGWNSVPGGVKPTYLKDHGHEVINPALDDDDFDTAVKTAQAEFDKHQPQVVVGSSRGGAVALNINSGDAKLVLLCPAWKNWGTVKKVKPETIILHSRNDHRLAEPAPLSVMLWACELLGSGQDLSQLDEDLPLDINAATSQKESGYICDACGEEYDGPRKLDQEIR